MPSPLALDKTTAFELLALAGFFISLYSFLVTQKLAHKKNRNYKPLCDLSDRVSCTRAFTSPHGKLFKFHNSLLGMFFYPALILLNILSLTTLIKFLVALAAIFSLWLAYISYIKMRNFCIVCSAIYLVNFLLLAQAFFS
ncbi:hypothetical protein D6817_01820 [Candidatus Pacearchaeota archaeon]|nr:MAG: hypothetical protein D6817_01820 [Candidatus Pacearchaeota archaeon]